MLYANGVSLEEIDKLEFIEPVKGTKGSAGWDIFAQHDFEISSIGVTFIDLGFSTKIPDGYYYKIVPRSGHGSLRGITIRNDTGIIDEDYRRNWGAAVVMDSLPEIKAEPMMKPVESTGEVRRMTVKRGQAIAQMILVKREDEELEKTEIDWEETDRKSGHGHTGH